MILAHCVIVSYTYVVTGFSYCTEMKCMNDMPCNETKKGGVCQCTLDFGGTFCESKQCSTL